MCPHLRLARGTLRPPFEPPAAGRARLALQAVVRLVADRLHHAADIAHGDGVAVSARRRRRLVQ